jgi:O-antigen ligase
MRVVGVILKLAALEFWATSVEMNDSHDWSSECIEKNGISFRKLIAFRSILTHVLFLTKSIERSASMQRSVIGALIHGFFVALWTVLLGLFAGLIAAVGGTKSVVIVPGIALTFAFVLIPFSGMYAIVATTPVNVEIAGPITVSRLAVLMGALSIYVQVVRRQIDIPRVAIWPEGTLVALFLVWVVIATLGAGGGGYVGKLGPWIIVAVIFFTILNYAEHMDRIKALFLVLGVVGVLEAFLVLAEAFFGFSPFGGWHEELAADRGGTETRVVGTSSHPILLAGFFQVVSASILTMVWTKPKTTTKLFWLACVGLVLSGWWFTYSRSSWIGMMVMLFVGMVLAHRLTRRLAIVGGIAGFSILAVFDFEPSAVINFVESFASIQKASVTSGVAAGSEALSWRTENWAGAWNLFLKHPLFGTGIDSSKALMLANLPAGSIAHQYISPEVPHNMFLLIMAELGGIAFALFMLIWVTAFRAGFRAMQVPEMRPYAVALVAIMAGQIATFFFNPMPREIWLSMGITMALGRAARVRLAQIYATKSTAPMTTRRRLLPTPIHRRTPPRSSPQVSPIEALVNPKLSPPKRPSKPSWKL